MARDSGGQGGLGRDGSYNSKGDLPQTKGTGPYRRQRDDDSSMDGGGKTGESHGEHPRMQGSLAAAGAHLKRQDTIDEYVTPGSYPGANKGNIP